MADVFLSYRNTPERRALVRRLAAILRAHEVTVWWDYGLEAGESYRAQITTELANARLVAPLWCAESVASRWVCMEAELGRDKLVPARLQKVAPPDAFEPIQAADLVGWDGAVGNPRVQAFVRRICERLGRTMSAPTDLIEELAHLPYVPPLPEIAVVVAPTVSAAAAGHDYAFWERQWDKQAEGSNLVALHAIAADAPRYFAEQAKARIADIEAGQRAREERSAKARAAAERLETYRQQGRIKVETRFVHGAPEETGGGWFKPGAGKTEWFRDLDAGPEMVVVPAGEFMMGSSPEEIAELCRQYPEAKDKWASEGPQHRVKLTVPFAVAATPVTRGQFAVFVAATNRTMEGGVFDWIARGSWRKPGFAQDDHHPVVCVSWQDAADYAGWLEEQTGKSYRLLSEAEWEYCCRATTITAYSTGETIGREQANFGQNEQGTTPVRNYAANGWGFFDMHGNVSEWCADTWHQSYDGAPIDGSVGRGLDPLRVLRGGSWYNVPQLLRSAFRDRGLPVSRFTTVGFRLARTLLPL